MDRETGLGWAGGYVGTGVSTTNLAGRTLRDLVGHEPTGIDELLRREAERSACGNLGPEEVAGRDVRGAGRGCEHSRLRPLPCARGAEKDEDHLMNPS